VEACASEVAAACSEVEGVASPLKGLPSEAAFTSCLAVVLSLAELPTVSMASASPVNQHPFQGQPTPQVPPPAELLTLLCPLPVPGQGLHFERPRPLS